MADPNAAPAQLNVLTQYVRRVVFENTAAIKGENPNGKPSINVQVNVENQDNGEGRYTVGLILTIETMNDDKEIFAVELDYYGIFQIANVPPNAIPAVLSVECPRLLFPFARRIIAEVTRDGGYPPLMLDPIDFAALFRRQVLSAQPGAEASGAETPTEQA